MDRRAGTIFLPAGILLPTWPPFPTLLTFFFSFSTPVFSSMVHCRGQGEGKRGSGEGKRGRGERREREKGEGERGEGEREGERRNRR